MSQAGSTGEISATVIPYRHESTDMAGTATNALLIAILLLAGCLIALWYAKRRGWLVKWITPVKVRLDIPGMELVQTLRLGPKTILYKIRDGSRDYVVLESTVHAKLVASKE